MKNLLIVCASLFLSACVENAKLEGKWIEPVPNMPEIKQGFSLEQGGGAESINMATLQYYAWEVKDNSLILSGKSIGNHQLIDFTEEYEIANIDDDKLTLKNGDFVREFIRCTDCE